MRTNTVESLGSGSLSIALAEAPKSAKKPVSKKIAGKANKKAKPVAEKEVASTVETTQPTTVVQMATPAPVPAPTPAAIVEAAKPVMVAEAPQAKPVVPAPAKKLSLKDRFLKAAAPAVEHIASDLAEAGELKGDVNVLNMFIQVMDNAEELAIQLTPNLMKEDIRANWAEMSLDAIGKQLEVWTRSGNSAASELLESLLMLKSNSIGVLDFMWQGYMIVLDARRVQTFKHLSEFLHNLSNPNSRTGRDAVVSVRYAASQFVNPTAVEIGSNTDGKKKLYFPSAQVTELVWPHIKAAEARVIEARSKFVFKRDTSDEETPLDILSKKETGLTPQQAEGGCEGKVFLDLGRNRGALIQVHKEDNDVLVGVVETAGMFLAEKWMKWSDDGSKWPNEDLFRAFQAWKNQR